MHDLTEEDALDAFSHSHYGPIVFTKAGERDTLGAIDKSDKQRFTPADGPTGSPQTWVTVGTQHHLLRVLDQPGPTPE